MADREPTQRENERPTDPRTGGGRQEEEKGEREEEKGEREEERGGAAEEPANSPMGDDGRVEHWTTGERPNSTARWRSGRRRR